MAIIVACSCGERFDVPDSAAGKQQSCPSCGQRLDIPSTPVFSLSSQKYLGPGAGWNPDDGVPTGEAFDKLPPCKKCGGSGRCPICAGKSTDYHAAAWWEGFKTAVSIWFFGLFGRMGWERITGQDNRISTARCVNCNGNGKCYYCHGYGKVIGA
jgi:hypothetical protein